MMANGCSESAQNHQFYPARTRYHNCQIITPGLIKTERTAYIFIYILFETHNCQFYAENSACLSSKPTEICQFLIFVVPLYGDSLLIPCGLGQWKTQPSLCRHISPSSTDLGYYCLVLFCLLEYTVAKQSTFQKKVRQVLPQYLVEDLLEENATPGLTIGSFTTKSGHLIFIRLHLFNN